MRYLTFALGKGRLAKQTLELFERIGITCEGDEGPRFPEAYFHQRRTETKVLPGQRAGRSPLMWNTGPRTSGWAGKDTILEEGRKVHEVLDLGYGKCTMCVCGKKEAAKA